MDHQDNLLCNDLKTERQDVSQGLPPYFKAIPVLFYIGIVAGLGLGTWFFLSLRAATVERDQWVDMESREKSAGEKLDAEMTEVMDQNERARDVVAWMEGAQAVQPLSVAITRSVAPTVTISELSLTRNAEIPSQIYFSLKMDGGEPDQIDRTLASLKELNYRAYSPSETRARDSLDYKATLIWQNPNR
ncbi:MAG: hypothetical protein ACC661_00415 [Verrucomicrobiales bacterium]